MENKGYDIKIGVSISVPIIGDESITQLRAPDGFAFKKIAFNDYKFKNRLIDGNNEIQLDYLGAVHGGDEKTIICLELEEFFVISHDKPANALGFLLNDDFDRIVDPVHDSYETRLWNYFAMIHLYKEGEIARKQAFYTYTTTEGMCTNTRMISPFFADMITIIRYPLIVLGSEVADFNGFLFSHHEAFAILKYIVIDSLEYTYHILDDVTNYINIINSLEVMFLINDYGQKKEMLAKRISVFLGGSSAEILQIYNDVKRYYVDRSNAVHDGNIAQINRASLDELRNLTRKATRKYISVVERELTIDPAIPFDAIRGNLVTSLKSDVLNKIAMGVLPQ